MNQHKDYLLQAVKLAKKNKADGGRPFAALLVKDGKILSTGVNGMLKSHDPSSHAEMEAIRSAAQEFKTFDFSGCTIYASGHPCPMCLSLILMSNVQSVYFAYDNTEGARFGLSTEATYNKLGVNLEKLPITFKKLDVGISVEEVYL